MVQSNTVLYSTLLSIGLCSPRGGIDVDAFSVTRRTPHRQHMTLMEAPQPASELTDWVIAGLEGIEYLLVLP